MLIPNKEYIYKEYLPNGIVEASNEKNIDRVVSYIRNNSDIKVAYPKEELLSMKETYPTYYKYDTHWNEIGAYVGYATLMRTLGKEPKSLSEWEVTSFHKNHGDLVGIAKLENLLPTYQEVEVNFSDEVTLLFDDEQENDSYQKYYYSNGSGKIFVMGDSFRMAMKPYLSRQYEFSFYVHRDRQLFREVLEEKPDVLVYQLVERYIPHLENSILTDEYKIK